VLDNNNQQKNFQHHLRRKNDAGFTLIELLIAIAVFTIGLLGSIGLATSNYSNSQDNLDKTLAVNLAQEGLELIRNVRDSNWLKIEANQEVIVGGVFDPYTWDSALSGNNYVYIDYDDVAPSAFPLACGGTLKSCVENCPNCQLYTYLANGYYSHDNTDSVPTKYSRGFRLHKICLSADGLTESLVDASGVCPGTHIGFQVTSHVQWPDNGQTKFIEVSDYIYNWRR
jgi:prepilin-type N-terminal cleavage/methylation domain-containing protein